MFYRWTAVVAVICVALAVGAVPAVGQEQESFGNSQAEPMCVCQLQERGFSSGISSGNEPPQGIGIFNQPGGIFGQTSSGWTPPGGSTGGFGGGSTLGGGTTGGFGGGSTLGGGTSSGLGSGSGIPTLEQISTLQGFGQNGSSGGLFGGLGSSGGLSPGNGFGPTSSVNGGTTPPSSSGGEPLSAAPPPPPPPPVVTVQADGAVTSATPGGSGPESDNFQIDGEPGAGRVNIKY